jgi:fucose permease
MGYVSDVSSIRYAFAVPLLCHLYVLYFALRGYQPVSMESKVHSTHAAEAI